MTPQAGSARFELGDCVLQLLVERGVLDPEAAAEAEAVEHEGGPVALEALVRCSAISPEAINDATIGAFGLEAVDLSQVQLSEDVMAAVPRELAIRYKVLPLGLDGGELWVAVGDPFDTDAADTLGHVLQRPVHCRLAPRRAIERATRRCYPVDSAASPSTSDVKDAGEAPIARYVRELIAEGLRRRASDIHLEPLEQCFRIRFRVDGVLHEAEGPAKRLHPLIVSRVKLMAGISIAEKRVPQDGRIRFSGGGHAVELRVSTLPTTFGESVVMRVLEKERLRPGLPELGMLPDDVSSLEAVLGLNEGVFLVTGPTGSGKSTTLYTALSRLNRSDRKIITVEDPVEYELSGVNQVQVRREVGMTFATALRAMLRQAPNTIMVGEIRDRETAEIAINAALTGHMVFSTLHTNDAPGAIGRLSDLGVKRFLIAAAVRAVLAQRLVRTVCTHCRDDSGPDLRSTGSAGTGAREVAQYETRKGRGCPECGNTGYLGRTGIFEFLAMTQELAEMVHEGATPAQISDKARKAGMRTMREDGLRKVRAGLTTFDEVLRVTVADAA